MLWAPKKRARELKKGSIGEWVIGDRLLDTAYPPHRRCVVPAGTCALTEPHLIFYDRN